MPAREERHAPTQYNIRETFSSVVGKCLRAANTSSPRDDAKAKYICALEKVDRIQQCTHTALVWRGRRLRPPADRRSSLPRPPAGKSSAAPGDSFCSHPLAHSWSHRESRWLELLRKRLLLLFVIVHCHRATNCHSRISKSSGIPKLRYPRVEIAKDAPKLLCVRWMSKWHNSAPEISTSSEFPQDNFRNRLACSPSGCNWRNATGCPPAPR